MADTIMITSRIIAPSEQVLPNETVLTALHQGLDGHFRAQKVLILIPDHTRSVPLPFLFRSLVDILHDARQLDFMVALGHTRRSARQIYIVWLGLLRKNVALLISKLACSTIPGTTLRH